MTDTHQVHLVLGDEDLFVERAVSSVIAQARAGQPDVPVDRLRAGDASPAELAELLSPSLFGDARVVVLDDADEAGKDAVAAIEGAVGDVPEGVYSLVWLDCATGHGVYEYGVEIEAGDCIRPKPETLGPEAALHLVRHAL